MASVISDSAAETARLGELLGMLAGPGDFIMLRGDLGSGKTQFAGGVATGLGVDPAIPVTSPTYTLLNSYSGRCPLHHFDLYRLSGAVEVAELGFDEYFEGDGVALLEWAERLQDLLPEQRLEVVFTYLDQNTRRISFLPHGKHYQEMVDRLNLHDITSES